MNQFNSPVQLIVEDSPRSGAWNMAFDESLLNEALATNQTFVRLYRWSEATVSLGYFQNEAERGVEPRLAALPCVRRLSGGGAILHHHEQTYSCCVPPKHPLAKQPFQLYQQIHSAVIEFMAELGVTLQPRGHDDKTRPEPFLCFLREAAPDLVFQDSHVRQNVGDLENSPRSSERGNGHKVLGSAQRRRRGAVLQHGSLLLRRSEFLPELPGLCDLATDFAWSAESCHELGVRLGGVVGHPIEAVSKHLDGAKSSGRELA